MVTLAATATDAEAASRVCRDLQSQLNRGSSGGSSAQYNKFASAAKRQQSELSKARRMFANGGCNRSNSGQCRSLGSTIRKMESNLAKLNASRDRARPAGGLNTVRVRAAMVANGCFGNQKEAKKKTTKKKATVQAVSVRKQPKKIASVSRSKKSASKKVVVRRGSDKAKIATVPVAKPDVPAPPTTLTSGYRSVCVRLCDGYFFPVSFSTDMSTAARDQNACSAMCPGSPVRLYMHKVPEEESEDMRDINGNRYVDLNTAFAYLKPRKASANENACRCGTPALPTMTPIPEKAKQEATDPSWMLHLTGRPEIHADPETMANAETGLTGETLSRLVETLSVGAVANLSRQRAVRVVGTEFLPDPEAAIDLQAQAQTSVQ